MFWQRISGGEEKIRQLMFFHGIVSIAMKMLILWKVILLRPIHTVAKGKNRAMYYNTLLEMIEKH